MRNIPVIVLSFTCSVEMAAQSVYYPVSSPNLSSAKISKDVCDAFTVASNPAMIPYIKGVEAGLYTEKTYLADQLHLLIFSACIANESNGASLFFQHFGNVGYHETTISLGYAKNLGSINAGVMMRYISLKISGYPITSMIQPGITAVAKISPEVYAGIKIINPHLIYKSKPDGIRAMSSCSLVVGWQASELVYAGVETIKEESRSSEVVFAMRYKFADLFTGTLVWSTASHQPFLSLGWLSGKFKLEAGCHYHAALGPSPSISILYSRK